MKAIETKYNGYRFRSRLEARWAVFFDKMGIRYEYEPEGLVLSDGTYYLPDFYLPDFHCYFEVKRAGIEGTPEGKEAIRKISAGMNADEWAGLICFGDPVDSRMLVYCQETDDGGGGSYWNVVRFSFDPQTGSPTLLALTDISDRTFWNTFSGEDRAIIPILTSYGGMPRYDKALEDRVVEAAKAARQARFEHGERLVTRQ